MHPGIKVNQARTNYGDTPLYVASQEGHVEIVKAPLAQPNINVNQAQTDLEWKGISPLWIASFNRHAELVKNLLKKSEIKVNQAQIFVSLQPWNRCEVYKVRTESKIPKVLCTSFMYSSQS